MLMNEKQFYTSPEVDVLVVRFEGMICASPFGVMNAAGVFFNDTQSNINDYTDEDF